MSSRSERILKLALTKTLVENLTDNKNVRDELHTTTCYEPPKEHNVQKENCSQENFADVYCIENEIKEAEKMLCLNKEEYLQETRHNTLLDLDNLNKENRNPDLVNSDYLQEIHNHRILGVDNLNGKSNNVDVGCDLSKTTCLSETTCDNIVPGPFVESSEKNSIQEKNVTDVCVPENRLNSHGHVCSSENFPNDQPLLETHERDEFGDMKEGRNRRKKPCIEEWRRNKSKKLRMNGEEYLGFTRAADGKVFQNKIRPARKMGPRCTSKTCLTSNVRSCHRLTEDVRKQLHSEFWSMNWDQRKVYVSSHVTLTDVKRKTTAEESRRGNTMFYSLQVGKEALRVCRETFLNTLSLKPFMVQSWVKKSIFGMHKGSETINTSRRDKNVMSKRRVLKDESVNRFFDQLAKLPSHYVRRDSSKLYLEESIRSLAQLYELYKEFCGTSGEKVYSRKSFESKFHEKNLSLFRPKKDMCDKCCEFQTGNLDEEKYRTHIEKKKI